jgi:hypothetical protein
MSDQRRTPEPDKPPGWPDPNERDCDACGHVWFAGERRHRYLIDEAVLRPDDAQVLCELCYRQRLVGDDDGGGGWRAAGRWSC